MTVVSVAALIGVFVLPWVTSGPIAVVQSESQALGFNNRAAMIGLVAGAIALFCLARFARRSGAVNSNDPLVSVHRAPPEDRVSPRLVWVAIALTMLMVAVVSAIERSYPFGDAQYFTNALLRVSAGGAPFSEVEFSYGPLLVYLPLLTWRLLRWTGLSIYPVYYCWVGVFQAAGLASAAHLLNRIRIRRTLRNAAFLIVGGFALLQPTLGLNYTPLRFLLAYVLFAWVMERLAASPRSMVRSVLPLAAVLAAACVSPDMGIALLLALTVALFLLVIHDSKRHLGSLAVLLSGALTIAVAASISGAGTFGAFAGGAFYFPILPGPPAVIFVGSVLLLAWGFGSAFDSSGRTDAALQAGWLALALVLVAPALGRADFGHLFFNGMGAMLVCAAVVDRRWHRGGIYLGVIAGIFLSAVLLWVLIDSTPLLLEAGVRSGVIPQNAAASIASTPGAPRSWTAPNWDAVAAGRTSEHTTAIELATIPSLAFPAPLKGEVGARLATSGHLVPLYGNPSGALNEADFRKEAAQLNDAQSLALPTLELEQYRTAARDARTGSDGLVMAVPTTLGGTARYGLLLGFPVTLRGRNEMFDPGASFGLLLQQEWIPYDRIGEYTLLKRR
ncbi:MAG TPA: hypothetical protein VIL41_07785 [Coriobacteriia bacterium]